MHLARCSSLLAPLLVLAQASAQGRSYRLNDRFPLVPGGDVSSVEVSADGAWIVYVADADEDDVEHLYSVPSDGSDVPRRITDDSGVGGGIFSVTITPDATRVLYSDTLAVEQPLYSVPIDGSAAAVELVGPYVTDFQVTPDSTRVVFRGDLSTDEVVELFSAPLDGSSEPVRLNAPLQPLGNVTAFVLSGDGSRVAYLADQDTDELFELYRAEVDGSAGPLKLSGTLVPGGDVYTGFKLDGDGSHAFFVADRETDNILELFAADGLTPPLKLSGPMGALGGVELDIQLSTDGAWVFYRADPNTSGFFELFRAPSDGSSGALRISGTGLRSPGVQEEGYRVTPDASRVVFRAYELGGGRNAFTVLADASAAPKRLNSGTNGFSGVTELELDPTGTRAVFRNDPGGARLYSVPADGSAVNVALTPLSGNQYVLEGRWQISPDGARVVYELITVSCCTDLRSVPIGGGAPVLLSPGQPYLLTFEIDPTARRVAFLDYPSSSLFLVPIDGAGAPVQLDPPGVSGAPTFAPDGAALLFLNDPGQGSYDLRATLLGKTARPGTPPGTTVTR